jgi:hypothetical protein
MNIVGFGQTFRLDREPAMGYEIRVVVGGHEVSIQTDEDTVSQLMGLADSSPTVIPAVRVPQNVESDDVEDVFETEREITQRLVDAAQTLSSKYPMAPVRPMPSVEQDSMGYPIVKNLPQPKFLRDEDEDGQQI